MRRTMGSLFALLLASSPAFAGAADYFTESAKDFGPTPRGPILTHYFTLKNTTDKAVNIGTPRVSCGCVTASVLKNQLKAGEITVVQTSMDSRRIPTAYTQKVVTVYVPFFSPTMEEVQLKVSAIARDDLVLSQEAVNFGSVRKGKAATATTKLTVYNQPTLQISDVLSTGGFIKAEAKAVATAGNSTTYEVTAALDDSCPVGNWTAELFVKTNIAGMEKVRVPVAVQVTTPILVNPEAVTITELNVGHTTEHRVMLQATQAFKVLQVKGVDDVVMIKANADESRPVHILTIAVKPKASGDLSRLLEIETDHREAQFIKLPITAVVPISK